MRKKDYMETIELCLFRLNEIPNYNDSDTSTIWNNPKVSELLRAVNDVKLILNKERLKP